MELAEKLADVGDGDGSYAHNQDRIGQEFLREIVQSLVAAWARDGRKLAKKLATVAGGACLQADNQNRSLQGLVWEASRTLDTKEHCSYCCLVNYLDEEPRRGDKLAG